jgi:hypothetical protein
MQSLGFGVPFQKFYDSAFNTPLHVVAGFLNHILKSADVSVIGAAQHIGECRSIRPVWAYEVLPAFRAHHTD